MANLDRHCFRSSPTLTKKINSFLDDHSLSKSDFFRSLLLHFFLYYENNSDYRVSFDSYVKRLKDEGLI